MKKTRADSLYQPRQGGNSDALAASFAEGARSAGHTVSHCSLRDKSLHFCLGCLSCQETPGCVLQDDMAEILSQMRTADVLVFATPIYFYEMSGQMKTLLDRTNPSFSGEYAFRAVYLLAAAAEAAPPGCGWCAPRSGGLACLFSQGHPARGCLRLRRHRGWRDTGFSRPVPGPRHGGRSMRWAFFLAALFLCLSGCSGPGCTCGTARNISNHGGLSYAYPMPRRPRRRVSCHPAGQPNTRALVRQLPMTLTLAELNGNEKYARLPEALPH